MSETLVNRVRHAFYLDSVALMRLSRTIGGMPGVAEAALMMATPANKRILADAGLLRSEGEAAGGGDLVIAVRARDRAGAEAALNEADDWLDRRRRRDGGGGARRPSSLRTALKAAPDSNLALISVPGEFAAAEARKALAAGLNVMLFSDNVPLADERALKREGQRRGRLVMGPDCGTAILGGVPLAFANRVPPGDIGIVGASGTGIQEIACLIARGGGISHAIGVGGRDLSDEIGGIGTLMALDALDRDPGTRHVVLVSKPPSASVAAAVARRIAKSDKRFTVCFIGASGLDLPPNARPASTLKAAAEHALGGTDLGAGFDPRTIARPLPPDRRAVRGLFSGGTLCAEAQLVFAAAGEPVASNVPIPGALGLADGAAAHRLLDLGDDAYTRGRPHPMLDPAVRADALRAELADPAVGIVLLDVVIGTGAHPDPAGALADVVAAAPGRRPVLIASVTGTDQDPQNRAAQVARLQAAGVLVAPSNADAAELALAHLAAG